MQFRGQYEFLSNFYPCKIVLDLETYPSVEHAYQAAKTTDYNARAMIRGLASAGQAKRYGKTVLKRPDWDNLKTSIMRDLVLQKFMADNTLKQQLLNTGTTPIEESNDWHDTYWGVCVCERHAGAGANFLGLILMQVREQARELQSPTTDHTVLMRHLIHLVEHGMPPEPHPDTYCQPDRCDSECDDYNRAVAVMSEAKRVSRYNEGSL